MPNGIKLQKLIVVAMSVLAFVLGCTAPKEVVVHESPVCEWSSYLFRVEAVDAETGLGLSVCRLEYSLALHDSKGESLEIFVPVGDFDGRGVVLFLDVTSANNVGHPAVLRVSREGYHPEKRQLRFEKMRATQWFSKQKRRAAHFVDSEDPPLGDAFVNRLPAFRLDPLR